ncbi:ATP-dependent helicase [Chitinophaga oryzae]|uniref:DNA 3'-5' helicase n=1 Tax=Chitinophaga oryzae TaxID=2725414 RepID=A0ABX6L8Z7_9BACT|nr:UvrD-helicase domain-containing protein [Chitinophaga oryzae]QJB36429.1 ATP-dependent helicase [Chitinophaga oryzae]
MQLTQEQLDIIQSAGNIKINAVAGSGKTTTIIEYAKSRPRHAKILYLAFNKSVRNDAIAKFENCGLTNVKVETAHSLAYKRIVFRDGYNVRNQGYRTHEIAELLQIAGSGEKHGKYIVANHINKFFSYFCNSDKMTMEELDYLDVVTDKKVRSFVKTYYNDIQKLAASLYQKMDAGEIDITHDFYLKKFQLEHPDLKFDYILFDEGQDASAAMLDIFLRQKAVKVIVGDTHQQIYSWRYAVNSLEKVDFKTFHLSTSFRFGPDIAHLASEVLKWKEYLGLYKPFSITGNGGQDKGSSVAVIARTNLGLLLNAIAYIEKNVDVRHIYFEGNINSYAYADDGTSLYDLLNFINNKRYLVKDHLIREMKNMAELEEYIEHTEDIQLATMLEIVREYGDDIPSIIRTLKDKHVDDTDKKKAAVIFSTVHRSKGMEYDKVILADDFVTEEKLTKMKKEEMNVSKLNEEINLLYVAITRTRDIIQIPESMIPSGFPSSQITVLKEEKPEITNKASFVNPAMTEGYKTATEKTYTFEEVRLKHKGAYMPWTEEQDNELTQLYCKGRKIKEMAIHFGRTEGAIRSRIKKLDLESIYGPGK